MLKLESKTNLVFITAKINNIIEVNCAQRTTESVSLRAIGVVLSNSFAQNFYFNKNFVA
jgi:hypothetical protein